MSEDRSSFDLAEEAVRTLCAAPPGKPRPTLSAFLRAHVFHLDNLRRQHHLTVPDLISVLARCGIHKADGEQFEFHDFSRRLSVARKQSRAAGTPDMNGISAAAAQAAEIVNAKVEERIAGLERGLALGTKAFAAALDEILARAAAENPVPPAHSPAPTELDALRAELTKPAAAQPTTGWERSRPTNVDVSSLENLKQPNAKPAPRIEDINPADFWKKKEQ